MRWEKTAIGSIINNIRNVLYIVVCT